MAGPWEERKLVTVLFADVTGSTGLGEQFDPEQLRAILSRFFAVMSDVIRAWGGTVEKYAGDAILAVFGVPTAREDDPARALRAALDMQARLEELNVELQGRHGVALQVRIGVNTGEVLAPTEPSPDRQLLVTGDAVNVAARLEQAAEPGNIMVGERTWQLTRTQFQFDSPIDLELRGKSAPVAARRLREAGPPGEAADRPLQAPLVGRDHELRALRGLFEETIENREPSLAILYGPAGIGKSRLTREFLQAAVEARPEMQVLRGRCLAAGRGITFWALAEVLRQCASISLGDRADIAADRLRDGVRRVLEPLGLEAGDVERAIHALAATAGLALPNNPLEGMSPEAVDEEMGRAWPLFASGLAAAAPTVIVAEDIHWADERLVEMLVRTATRAHGPLLLLATARPEFAETHPGFGTTAGATAVSLRPLTEDQGAELVAGLLADTQLPPALRGDILERAEGNPFFVEELVAGLIDRGVLVPMNGGWRVMAAAAADLPDTVHAVLAARIDALPVDEKRVLQEASVFGRSFWPGPLHEQLPDIDVPAALRSLERRGLVLERPTSALPGQVEYWFKHQLVRDVAYSAVPKARRSPTHAAVAEWTVGLAGDRYDEFGELIAFHYRMAAAGDGADLAWADQPDRREEVRRRAFEALMRAGASARSRSALTAAVELHSQALELATNDVERALAHEELGDDHVELFHGDDALAAWQAAIHLARLGPDSGRVIARVAAKVGKLGIRFGTFRGGGPPAEVLDGIVQEGLGQETDLPTRARLLLAFANMSRLWVGTRMGRMLGSDRVDPVPAAEREAAGREALAAATEIGDPELLFLASDAVAEDEWARGDYRAYFQRFQDMLPLVERLSTPSIQAELMNSVANSRIEAGDLESGLALSRRCLEVSAKLSAHQWMHASWSAMVAAYSLGRWELIIELFDQHRAKAAQEPDVICVAVRAGPLLGATVLVQSGEERTARDLVPLPSRASGPPISYAFAGFVVRYALLLGDNEVARSLVAEMVPIARKAVMRIGTPELVDGIADLGDWPLLEDVLPAFKHASQGLAVLEPIIDRAEGRRLASQGELALAADRLESAIAGFDGLKMPLEAARAREILADLVPERREDLLAAAVAAYRAAGAGALVERINTATARP